jgi:predicted transcriptional regulator
MIKATITITADTEEHYQQIVEEIYKDLKKGYQSEAYYIWENSYHKVIKEQVKDLTPPKSYPTDKMTTAELLRQSKIEMTNVKQGQIP